MPPPGNQYKLPSQRADRIRQWKDAYKEWRNMAAADKTWPNFKRHFAAAYADNLEETTATGM
eukprot:5981663-Ditylum_brightwellii.AAC.1